VTSAIIDTPVGELMLIGDEGGLAMILWPDQEKPSALAAGSGSSTLLGRATQQLTEYFAGQRRDFDLPIAPAGTAFQHEVWRVLMTIGYGETRTYGDIAAQLGDRGASRAVGNAVGRNPLPLLIPCHRVIGSDGSLTGFAGGIAAKRYLLAMEQGQQGLGI
jgi:methylated-DNA-[protein]-cysteine S-methyltransferase